MALEQLGQFEQREHNENCIDNQPKPTSTVPKIPTTQYNLIITTFELFGLFPLVLMLLARWEMHAAQDRLLQTAV